MNVSEIENSGIIFFETTKYSYFKKKKKLKMRKII